MRRLALWQKEKQLKMKEKRERREQRKREREKLGDEVRLIIVDKSSNYPPSLPSSLPPALFSLLGTTKAGSTHYREHSSSR